MLGSCAHYSWSSLHIAYGTQSGQKVPCPPNIKHLCSDHWLLLLISFFFFFFNFFFNFYLFMTERERERERGRDIGRGRSRLHAPGARRGIQSWVSRIPPWAKGQCSTTAPPRDPHAIIFWRYLCIWEKERERSWVGRGVGKSRLNAFFFPFTQQFLEK